jgi:hypothetical protein
VALALLKRTNCTEQELDGAEFLARRTRQVIRIRASEIPLAPVEIPQAEQQGSRLEQVKEQAGLRQQKSRPPE